MSNSITIQLRPTSKYSPPSIANLFHNTGLSKATYWLKDTDNIVSNLDLKSLSTKDAVNLWRKWEQEAIDLVIKNKGKNPQKKQVLIEEGLLVIGKDVLEKDPKMFIKIFEEFSKWFEKKYNTKILGYFYHNHEGHIDLNEGEFITNLHIHFFFLNVDKKGLSVRRQIKKTDLSNFQTKIHQIGKEYIPTLERAVNYKELGLKAPKHKSHREYRIEKTKQAQLKLAPEIQAIKKENNKLKNELAKVKDLKDENKTLREILKENKAERKQYAELEAFIKDLKEKIKTKEVTLQELKEQMELKKNELLNQLSEKDKKIKKLEEENKEFITPVRDSKIYEELYFSNDVKIDDLKQKYDNNIAKINKVESFKDYADKCNLKYNLEEIEEENENTLKEVKKIEKLHNRQEPEFDPYDVNKIIQKPDEIEEKIYMCKIISKRLELINKKLTDIEEKLNNLINKMIEKEPKLAEFFQEQAKTQLKQQTKSEGPKI